MTTSHWRTTALGLGVAFLATNAWWLYSAIDGGITATYREQTAQECEAQAKQLEVIANHYVAGKPLSEVQPFLLSTAAASDTFPKPEEQLIIVGTLALRISPDKTVEALVRDLYEP